MANIQNTNNNSKTNKNSKKTMFRNYSQIININT